MESILAVEEQSVLLRASAAAAQQEAAAAASRSAETELRSLRYETALRDTHHFLEVMLELEERAMRRVDASQCDPLGS